MSFRLVPKSLTLNDLERRNGRYIAIFHRIWWTCVPTHNRVDLWRNLCTSLLYFVVRAVVHDVVVKKVHVRYLISWWVSCIYNCTEMFQQYFEDISVTYYSDIYVAQSYKHEGITIEFSHFPTI